MTFSGDDGGGDDDSYDVYGGGCHGDNSSGCHGDNISGCYGDNSGSYDNGWG